MAKKKINVWIKYFILPIVLSIVVLGAVLVYRQNKVGEATTSNSKVNTSEPTVNLPLDEVKDGYYINNKYGFKFKYPSDVFISSSNSKSDTSEYFYTYKNRVGGNNDANLWVAVEDSNISNRNDAIYRFDSMYQLPIGKTNSHIIIVSKDDFGSYKRLIEEAATSDNTFDKGYSYMSLYRSDNMPVVEIVMDIFSSNSKDYYKVIFDKIVDSLEFIQ